jgi:hypothetical protein
MYADLPTWGSALEEMWKNAGETRTVEMAKAKWEIEIK